MHGSHVCMVPLLLTAPSCCREMKERAYQRSLQNRRSASQPSVQGAAR